MNYGNNLDSSTNVTTWPPKNLTKLCEDRLTVLSDFSATSFHSFQNERVNMRIINKTDNNNRNNIELHFKCSTPLAPVN